MMNYDIPEGQAFKSNIHEDVWTLRDITGAAEAIKETELCG